MRVLQKHHICYSPEITVIIYQGEHWAITQLQRRKFITKGFIEALKYWIRENESKAIDVTAQYEIQKVVRNKKSKSKIKDFLNEQNTRPR